MSDTRCSIGIVVNGGRWQQEGDALVSQKAVPRTWSLGGLQDYVRLTVGARLGHVLEQIDLREQRWCRTRSNAADGEAVAAGFSIVTSPHVGADDPGAGLSLEAVEIALTGCQVVVSVGGQMQWMPLRQKLEAAGVQLIELLLPATGKVVVSSERVIDLRELARRGHGESPVSALFKPIPVALSQTHEITRESPAPQDDSFAANAITGVVKSLAKGYGIVARKDGRGDVQFLAAHVAPPGFDFIEVGDSVRFDVVRGTNGKWLAQRVVRA